jgi:hypothetical protein
MNIKDSELTYPLDGDHHDLGHLGTSRSTASRRRRATQSSVACSARPVITSCGDAGQQRSQESLGPGSASVNPCCFDDVKVVGVSDQVAEELDVDLEVGDGRLLEVGEAAEAGSDVVEGQAATERPAFRASRHSRNAPTTTMLELLDSLGSACARPPQQMRPAGGIESRPNGRGSALHDPFLGGILDCVVGPVPVAGPPRRVSDECGERRRQEQRHDEGGQGDADGE